MTWCKLESEEHERLKSIIGRVLEAEGYNVEIEKRIGRQVYDIVATLPGVSRPRFVEIYVNTHPPRYKEAKESNITCTKCGYKWPTESKRILVTCPGCGRKTPNPNAEVKT